MCYWLRSDWLRLVALASLLACAAHGLAAQPVMNAPTLQPQLRQPLPLGAIKPAGWLRRQLEIQASSLGGQLDLFWPDLKNSAWIGGQAEGWERGPYWLDGFIPLAVQLEDAQLKRRAQHWIDYILDHPQSDGWLGPVKGNPSASARAKQYDTWPRFVLLKALTQWQEATGDPRVLPTGLALLRRMDAVLNEHPLTEWARVRWADLVVSIYWYYDRTREPWLLDLAAKVRRQGLDWPSLAHHYPFQTPIPDARLREFQQQFGGHWINDHFGATHGVNVAMGLKAAGVWSRQSGQAGDRQAIFDLLAVLDRYHGQPAGLFSCDEHIAGPHPSQGTELCTVVEMMYSLEVLLAILPESELADRLELLAYNALPATFTDDMWAHQYVQQANQVACRVSQERLYMNNGPDANLFGLEPNFGCCLANFHQGWPKFTSHLWMRSGTGLAALTYAPCDLQAELPHGRVNISVRGDYPFSERVELKVRTDKPGRFPLDLRVPAWAKGASVSVNGAKPRTLKPGQFHTLDRTWSGEDTVLLTLPMPLRVTHGFNQSASVFRGPLLFALEVKADWRKLRDRGLTADWEVLPASPWNYALVLDPKKPAQTLQVHSQEVSRTPFSVNAPPVWLTAQGHLLPQWGEVKNAADAPPLSPVAAPEATTELRLVPYGAAKLRVAALPWSKR